MSRFVTVWPGATLTVSTYCRGKLGPVAVSFSGPTYVLVIVITVGVVVADSTHVLLLLLVLPGVKIVGSTEGLFNESEPNWNPPRAVNSSGTPRSAKLDSAACNSIVADG